MREAIRLSGQHIFTLGCNVGFRGVERLLFFSMYLTVAASRVDKCLFAMPSLVRYSSKCGMRGYWCLNDIAYFQPQ